LKTEAVGVRENVTSDDSLAYGTGGMTLAINNSRNNVIVKNLFQELVLPWLIEKPVIF